MNIRAATSSDIDQLSQLFDQYRIFYRKASDIDRAKEFLTMRITKEDSVIYISESSDGDLNGFVQLYPLFSSTRMQKLWLLNDLFIAVPSRGRGISKALIERAKQLVINSNAAGMFLETEVSNDIGNSLYPSCGFTLNSASNYYEWSPK